MNRNRRANPRRGEVWLVRFYPKVGAETTKVRPAAVISVDSFGYRLPLRVVVPITSGNPGFKNNILMVPIAAEPRNGLSHDSWADTFQIKNQSIDRFIRKLGELKSRQMEQIIEMVALCIGYQPPRRP